MSRESLPEDLEALPPGPLLAALLAEVDRSVLDAGELLRLAQARNRLIAHQEAQLLADLHAVARAVPDSGPQPGRRDPGSIRGRSARWRSRCGGPMAARPGS